MSRLVATTAYLVVDAVRGQRPLVPVVLHAAVLGVLVANEHHGPPGPWPASVLLVHATAAWIALATANTPEPAQRDVLVAAAGGPGRVSVATVLAAAVLTVPSVVLGTVVPVLVAGTGPTVGGVVAALAAHLAAAGTGVAVGVVGARPLVPRVGWSAALVGVAVIVLVAQPALPPVGAAARAVSMPSPPPGALAGDVAVAVGLLLVAAVAVRAGSARR